MINIENNIIIYIIVILSFVAILYYIKRKFDSIDKHTDKKYQNKNILNTYKEDRKEYKKDITDLEAKIMPDTQTVINIVDKINDLKK